MREGQAVATQRPSTALLTFLRGQATQTLKLTDPACQVSVDLKAQKVQVQSTDDRQTLADALTEAGYPPA